MEKVKNADALPSSLAYHISWSEAVTETGLIIHIREWTWLAGAAFISRCSDNKIIRACKKSTRRRLEFIATSDRGIGCSNGDRFLPSECKIWALNLAVRIFVVRVGNLPVSVHCFWTLMLDFRRCSPEFMWNEAGSDVSEWVPQEFSGHAANCNNSTSLELGPCRVTRVKCWLPCNYMRVVPIKFYSASARVSARVTLYQSWRLCKDLYLSRSWRLLELLWTQRI